MPIGALLPSALAVVSALLPRILEAAPALTRIFSTSPTGERNAQALEKVAEVITASTGSTNVQEGVEKIESDPEAADSFRAAVKDNWFELQEASEKSVAAAREADAAFVASGAKAWESPAFLISCVLLFFVFLLLLDFLFIHPTLYDNSAATQIITGILGLLLLVGGYHLGSSQGSVRKTELAAGATPR